MPAPPVQAVGGAPPPRERARFPMGVDSCAALAAAVMTKGSELCRGEDAWRLFGEMDKDAPC